MDTRRPPAPALIVHAGAWAIPPDELEAHRMGCLAAVEAGWAALDGGAPAPEVVVAAVSVLEASAGLNAGVGAVLNREGVASLDAGLMAGSSLGVGAVAGLTHVLSPIRAAAEVLDSRHVLLHGRGAEAFLQERGMPLVDQAQLVVPREVARLEAWHRKRAHEDDHGTDFGDDNTGAGDVDSPADTVGAVAVDRRGRIAAGASTGGLCGKRPGRIGDTPIPGAGFYADDLTAGAACTGFGEALLRMGLARRACDLTREHTAQDAAWLAIRELEDRFEGRGGVILIARDGSIGFAFNTPKMAVAYMDRECDEPVVGGGV
jgi:beta-aspartyl-peptidase (threonine type)